MASPHVTYPMKVGQAGNLFFPLHIPVNDTTLAGGLLQLKVVDSAGRTGIGALSMKTPP